MAEDLARPGGLLVSPGDLYGEAGAGSCGWPWCSPWTGWTWWPSAWPGADQGPALTGVSAVRRRRRPPGTQVRSARDSCRATVRSSTSWAQRSSRGVWRSARCRMRRAAVCRRARRRSSTGVGLASPVAVGCPPRATRSGCPRGQAGRPAGWRLMAEGSEHADAQPAELCHRHRQVLHLQGQVLALLLSRRGPRSRWTCWDRASSHAPGPRSGRSVRSDRSEDLGVEGHRGPHVVHG